MWWANLVLAVGLLLGASVLAFSQTSAQPDHPQLVAQGHFFKTKLELLITPAGVPHILWREAESDRPFDRKLHLATLLHEGWREILSPMPVSSAAPIGAYDLQGMLYLATQDIIPWDQWRGYTASIYTMSETATTPTQTVLIKRDRYIDPKLLVPPIANHPLHLIFESEERRLVPWWTGHFTMGYGKSFSTQWDGRRWTKPVQFVDRGYFDMLTIACAAGEPPYVACVWSDSRYGADKQAVFFADYDGIKWSKNMVLGEGQRASLLIDLAITARSAEDVTVAFVPWQQGEGKALGYAEGLFVQERRAGRWGSVQQLAMTKSPPSLSTDLQGRVHVVWPEQSGIQHRMRSADGWTPARVLAPRYANAVTPLRFSADGRAHLAWMTMTDQPDPKDGLRQDQIWYQAIQFE